MYATQWTPGGFMSRRSRSGSRPACIHRPTAAKIALSSKNGYTKLGRLTRATAATQAANATQLGPKGGRYFGAITAVSLSVPSSGASSSRDRRNDLDDISVGEPALACVVQKHLVVDGEIENRVV